MSTPIQQYEVLTDEGKWLEALPVIRNIVDLNPAIDTSWFNLGACLDELGKHDEAAEAFIKAQELNVEDYGIHYRILRSFYLADDLEQFLEFADYSCGINPQVIESLLEDKDFKHLFTLPEFVALKEKYTQNQRG